ncbi:MAG: flagellar motor protein MotB [Polyangiales bacterium]
MDIDTLDDEGGGGDEGAPAWMATFSDLATLLLTFFVLLLSFANMDVTEFKEMMGSVREAFGVQFRTRGDFEALAESPISIGDRPPAELAEVVRQDGEQVAELVRALQEREIFDDVEVFADREGIAVRVRDCVLFDTGNATLREDAPPLLTELGAIISSDVGAYGVIVEGHTDDRPIHTERFPSNWELSTARATTVLRHLLDESHVDPARLSAAGFADMRAISPNVDDAARAQNRRVEFVFRRRPNDTERNAVEPADAQRSLSESTDE